MHKNTLRILMHEIRDLTQGFTVTQVTNNMVYICIQYGIHMYSIYYTYVNHIVSICLQYCSIKKGVRLRYSN